MSEPSKRSPGGSTPRSGSTSSRSTSSESADLDSSPEKFSAWAYNQLYEDGHGPAQQPPSPGLPQQESGGSPRSLQAEGATGGVPRSLQGAKAMSPRAQVIAKWGSPKSPRAEEREESPESEYTDMLQQATLTRSRAGSGAKVYFRSRNNAENDERAQVTADALGVTVKQTDRPRQPSRPAPPPPPTHRTHGGLPARNSYYEPRFPQGSGARAKDKFYVAEFHQDVPQREIDTYYYPRNNPSKQPKARGALLFQTEWMQLVVGMHVNLPRSIISVPSVSMATVAQGNSIRAEAIDIEYTAGGPDFAIVWFKSIGSSQIFSVGINDLMCVWLDEGNPTT